MLAYHWALSCRAKVNLTTARPRIFNERNEMKSRTSTRLLAGMVTTVALILGGVGLAGPANAAVSSPATWSPSAANLRAVATAQASYSKTVTPTEFAATKALYNTFLAEAESPAAPTSASASITPKVAAAAAKTCFTITKAWATALAWTAIVGGGVAVVVGIVAAATGAGLILTAVLGAVGYASGESGNLLLEKVNSKKWPETVCV